jgi:hypothetical protein
MTRLSDERRKPFWHQYLFQMVVPGLILATVTWGAGSLSDLKVEMREKNAIFTAHLARIDNTFAAWKEEFHQELYNHTEETRRWAERNSVDHHREMMTPCNKCHTK